MNHLTGWISPDIMQPLAWTLLHFLWQGLALAAMAAAVMSLFRSATVRYAIAVGTLAAMVIAVCGTFIALREVMRYESRIAERAGLTPALEITQGLASTEGLQAVKSAAHTMKKEITHGAASLGAAVMPSGSLLFLLEAWFAGVVFFSLRTIGGFVMLERMRRRDALSVDPALLFVCKRLQQRLQLDRVIRYLECTWLEAPAVIGWFRPIVMLPVAAVTGLNEEQLEAVIAHELAHIKRLDSFVNVAQIAIETVLFYHPAVWWLNRTIRAERENCCDDIAIAMCGNRVEYARALTLMETWRVAPQYALAVNQGSITARITRLLGISPTSGKRSVGLAASVVCLTAALVAGNAFLGTVTTRAAGQAAASSNDLAPAAPTTRSSKPAVPAPPAPGPVTALAASALPAPAPLASPEQEPQSEPATAPKAPEHTSGSYIEGLKSQGLTNLGTDVIVAMKIQGITPEYVRGIHEQGLHPDPEELIAMKVQGITPQFISDLKAKGMALSADRLIAMKVQGVTPEYVSGLQSLGMQPSADELIAMKVQGVTPDYIREMNALGLKLAADNAVAMKVQGISPDYVRGIQQLGMHPTVDQLIGMKVQGITPDYIRDLDKLGVKPTIDQLIGMKVQGIDATYVKGMQAEGLKLTEDQLIAARVQGVTPDFVERAKKHGFNNLTIDKLIRLKMTGVLDGQADL